MSNIRVDVLGFRGVSSGVCHFRVDAFGLVLGFRAWGLRVWGLGRCFMEFRKTAGVQGFRCRLGLQAISTTRNIEPSIQH